MKTILVDAIHAFVVENESGFQIFEPLHTMLDSFTERKIILTGANDEQFKTAGLDNMPYEVFTLKHDPEKRSPRYFQIFLKQFNMNPRDAIYFEHDPLARESARSLGIQTFLWDDATRPVEALRLYLLKNLT